MTSPLNISGLFSRENEETQAVDLRISGNWAIAVLIIAAILVMIAAIAIPDFPYYAVGQNLALVIFALTVLAVLVYSWRPQFGKIIMLIGLVVCLLLSYFWMQFPWLLLLLAIPVLLAAVGSSLLASLVFAVGESILLIICFISGLLPNASQVILTLALIWSAFCLSIAIYFPVYQAVSWYRGNFNQTQIELKELRAERESRDQLINDLDTANRQMVSLYNKISMLRQVAEDAEKSKALFVAKVSHEFRTPLSMIIGLSGLMIRDQEVYAATLPADLVEDMEVINRNCEHMAKLVDDVLDLTRAEAGQLTISRDWTEITSDIQDAISEIYPLLKKKKLELDLDIPGDLPRVFCDRMRIRQVVLNLIGNAVRYTEEGRIRVAVSADDIYMTFEIADTGPGIPVDDLELIFEPFSRGHNRPTSEHSGSGLGLSICRQFVEMHGGKIWVNSEPGMGSIFSFKILIHPPETPTSGPARWINQEKNWRDRRPRLTVDSTPNRQRVMVYDTSGDFFQRLQHRPGEIEFEHAGSLEEIIEQSRQNPVAAVLVNSGTPETTLQMVEQCRTRISDTPVVGCVFRSYLEKLKELQVSSFLAKPISLDDLHQAILKIPGETHRILIVDDDIDLCNLLTRMLLRLDDQFQIITASSGEEALKLMQSKHFDLMLLDILLGGMNGWEVIKARNASAKLHNLPIIILSGEDPFFVQHASTVMVSAFGEGLSIENVLINTLNFSALMFKTG